MESGEYENRKAFEEVTTKNVKTMIGFSEDTRELIRNFEERMIKLESILRQQNVELSNFRLQLAGVQAKLFNGGTT